MRQATETKTSGRLEINYHEGHAMEATLARRVKIKRTPTQPLAQKCPECERTMEGRDYGNLWVCACGAKRTKAQLQKGYA